MGTERITVNLPQGFDPGKHLAALERRIADTHGEGFEVTSINVKTRVASATRQATITEVSANSEDSFEVRLPKNVKPSDGERVATRLSDEYVGCEMTRFEPFLGKATLTKSSPEVSRARGALAVALGVKPWEVQVVPRPDGGFELELPNSYVPSKHDEKLDEVAIAVVGRPGWYVRTNPQQLRATIIPSDPPTFPPAIAYPFENIKKTPRDQLLIGMGLAEPGQKNQPLILDFETGPHTQISGTSGSGKSVLLNTMITGVLAGGSELVIIDLPHKAQPLTTRIPVPISDRFKDGWAMIGDLVVGDEAYSRDGSITPVTGLAPIEHDADVYEVEFSDGQVIKADGGHLWPVQTFNDRQKLSQSYKDARNKQRSATRTRIAERTGPLKRLAIEAATTRRKANIAGLAELIGTGTAYVSQIVRRAGTPSIEAPTEAGVQRLYSVDEFLTTYIDILERDLTDAKSTPGYRLITTKDISENLHATKRGQHNYSVPLAAPVGGPDLDLPIAPYILGTWLGDGSTNSVDGNSSLFQSEGLVGNKHVPAIYLRASKVQRAMLLQGLLDSTGGEASAFTASSELLAEGVLELARSLGFAATVNHQTFTVELNAQSTQRFIVDVRQVATEPVRCITVGHPEHLFLTEGFVPTHNSVDFFWCKDFVRDGGWGCASLAHQVTTLALVYEEGQRRAKVLADAGATKWTELPKAEQFKPIFVLIDEVTGLIQMDDKPQGVPKDHPMMQEVLQSNLLRATLLSHMKKIAAEMRFVGIRMVLSSQVSSVNTGIPTALRMNLINKAQPLTTRTPVPISNRFKDGWALFGDLQVGDKVFAVDGSETDITGLTPIREGEVYRVHLDDGQVVEADAGHIWEVSTRSARSADSPVSKARRTSLDHRRDATLDSIRDALSGSAPLSVGEASALTSLSKATIERALAAENVPWTTGRFTTSSGVTRVRRTYGQADLLRAVIRRMDSSRREVTSLMTTEEMALCVKVTSGEKDLNNFAIRLPSAIEAPEASVPVEPYVLGAWLGDGSACSGEIAQGTSAECTDSTGTTDQQHMIRQMAQFKARPKPSRPDGIISTTGLQVLLRDAGVLNNKHIPADYLRASKNQRLSLLQGLMDTDGCVTQRGDCVYTTVSEVLAEGVIELVRSLGIKASVSTSPSTLVKRDPETGARTHHRTGKTAYQIHFRTAQEVCRLPRKLERLPKQKSPGRADMLFITKIERTENDLVRCVEVAHPEHLYLTEGFVPTHNCLLGANPTDGNRKLALSDPTSVPKVPDNVRQDGKASKGVGVGELEGQPPSVFKSFYAPTEDFRKALDALGLRKTLMPEPGAEQIARLTPSLEDDGSSRGNDKHLEGRGPELAPSGKPAAQLRKEMGDEQDWAIDPETGKPLTGYAKANAARSAVVAGSKKPPRKPDANNPFADA